MSISEAQIVTCPACASTAVRAVEEWRLGIKRKAMACSSCGLLFSYPQPSEEALQEFYGHEGGWHASRSDQDSARAQTKGKGKGGLRVLEMLDEHIPPGPRRVLDFGCGNGSWLNMLQDQGWQTFGIEPSTDAAFVRHRQLTAIPADACFDLVVAYHVLEHLPRPLDTLRQLAGSLRPGGYFFASVPRLDTVSVHRDVKYCLSKHHIVSYTEACLRGLIARAGMEAVAALHHLDEVFTKGRPVRLRLLARKVETPVSWPDPEPALEAVLQSLRAMPVSAGEA